MNLLQRLPAQFLAAWRGLSPRRRAVAVACAVVTALAVGAFAYLSSAGDYRVLFANLAVEDVGAITAKLQAQGVPYRLDAGGTTILVPEERLVPARVSLAADGVPAKGGKGFELFDDAPLGMTPFVQGVNYTRALQAELARSIMQLEPVAAARVIVARADPTPFVRDQRPSTASVVLKLKPGAALSRATATGIVALVAQSVEGLRPENVTLVDSTGRMLSDARPGEPDGGALAGQIEYRRELETYLAGKAEEMLARHLGPGRAVVRVTADVNFQLKKERKESYSPEAKVVASERTVVSKSTAPATTARGAAGTASNLGRGAAGGGAAGGTGTSQEESAQVEYLVSKTVNEMEDRMGGLQRLTVAAMVDLAPGDNADGRASIGLADAQDIIKQAVGFRGGRDEIKVSDVRLTGALPLSDVTDDAAQFQKIALYIGLARNLALAVAVVMAVAMLWLLLRRRRPAGGPAPAENSPTTNGHVNGHAAHPAFASTPSGPLEAAREEVRRQELNRITELAERNPEHLAELLETLLGGANRA